MIQAVHEFPLSCDQNNHSFLKTGSPRTAAWSTLRIRFIRVKERTKDTKQIPQVNHPVRSWAFHREECPGCPWDPESAAAAESGSPHPVSVSGRCVGRSGRVNRCVCGYPGYGRGRRVGCRRTIVANAVHRRLNVQTVSRTASWHDPPRQSGQRMNQKHLQSRRGVYSGFFRLGVRYRDVRVRMFQSTRPVTFPGPISIAARPPVNSILRVFQVCLLADGSLPWAMSHSAGTSIRNRLTIRSNGTGGSRPNPGVPPA